MRTIPLTEYQPRTEQLDDDELKQLIATGLVGVTPRGDGRYELRPESSVGTVVLPGLRLLIRPKVGLPNVFFLLAYGAGLTRWDEQRFPYERDDLLAAVAWLLEAEVRRATRIGLVRDYREREEALPIVRGRIDLAAQIRRRRGQPIPLDCRFQDYDEDTALNRVLKAALRRMIHTSGVDPDVRLGLRHHHRLFAAVEDVDFSPAAVPDLSFNRRNESWETAARLGQLILRADSIRDQVGDIQASSFLVDMSQLFEKFVETVVGEIARRRGWLLEPQARRRLTDSVWMKPDLVLLRGGVDCGVGDAKYKELEPGGWRHADLYQLLAYCVALGVGEGLLIYGEADRTRREVVRRAGTVLEVVGVDLSQPARSVLTATRHAADRLVTQAERHSRTLAGAA